MSGCGGGGTSNVQMMARGDLGTATTNTAMADTMSQQMARAKPAPNGPEAMPPAPLAVATPWIPLPAALRAASRAAASLRSASVRAAVSAAACSALAATWSSGVATDFAFFGFGALCGGGGGGRPNRAQAGGCDGAALDGALEAASDDLKHHLG